MYTLKVSKLVTHVKRFVGSEELVADFYKVGEELKEKMGCFLFQLPPSLKSEEKKSEEIISQLDLEKRNVLEFRHISWFTQNVFDVLRENGVVFCVVSSPKLPEDIVKTSGDIYIRFHGRHIAGTHQITVMTR